MPFPHTSSNRSVMEKIQFGPTFPFLQNLSNLIAASLDLMTLKEKSVMPVRAHRILVTTSTTTPNLNTPVFVQGSQMLPCLMKLM